MRKSIIGAVCVYLAVVSFNATAALYDRGGGLIYDDVQDITWLQDASFGAGSPYDDNDSDGTTDDGRMTDGNAYHWADSLSYYDAVRDVTWDDWRLPTGLDWRLPVSLTPGNEMSHLYYVDSVSSSEPGLFVNVQPGWYWTGTLVNVPSLGLVRIKFDFENGVDSAEDDTYDYSAWAVRNGDVGAVPVPAAVWLFSSGLIGLIGLARRKVRT